MLKELHTADNLSSRAVIESTWGTHRRAAHDRKARFSLSWPCEVLCDLARDIIEVISLMISLSTSSAQWLDWVVNNDCDALHGLATAQPNFSFCIVIFEIEESQSEHIRAGDARVASNHDRMQAKLGESSIERTTKPNSHLHMLHMVPSSMHNHQPVLRGNTFGTQHTECGAWCV